MIVARSAGSRLLASSPIWEREASLARERESARASGVLARLALLAQIGEVARRLERRS